MYSTSQQKGSPRALVGKVLLINGVVFVGISLLAGAYTLFAPTSTTTTRGNSLSTAIGLLALIFALVGLLLGLVGLLLWLLPSGESPTGTVVHQFYTALEIQDYTTAFQYLDLSIGTPWGQMTRPEELVEKAQAEFITKAQEYDAQYGKITHYALTGVQANPSRRLYTIKVTRLSGDSYKTRLRLMKQGYNWKIVGFDRF
jgi:hypothetical protein